MPTKKIDGQSSLYEEGGMEWFILPITLRDGFSAWQGWEFLVQDGEDVYAMQEFVGNLVILNPGTSTPGAIAKMMMRFPNVASVEEWGQIGSPPYEVFLVQTQGGGPML